MEDSPFPFGNGYGQLLRPVTAAQSTPLHVAECCIMKKWLRNGNRFVQLSSTLLQRKNKMIKICVMQGTGTHVLGAPLRPAHLEQAVPEMFINLYGGSTCHGTLYLGRDYWHHHL